MQIQLAVQDQALGFMLKRVPATLASTLGKLFLFAVAAMLINVAAQPGTAAAQSQVPNPIPRPHKPPGASALLPAPTASVATAGGIVTGKYAHGRVIILRGLYNVFSRGMDQLAKDLEGLGVPVLVQNHSRWQVISAKVIEEYRANSDRVVPLVIIGHSLGGDATIVMSNWLALNGVPVRLAVILDAVAQGHPIIGGVQEVINYYKPKGYGQKIDAAPSFKGVINNVDLTTRKDVNHLNIDEDAVLQQEVLAKVMGIVGGIDQNTLTSAKPNPSAAVADTPTTATLPPTAPSNAPISATAPPTTQSSAPTSSAASPPPDWSNAPFIAVPSQSDAADFDARFGDSTQR